MTGVVRGGRGQSGALVRHRRRVNESTSNDDTEGPATAATSVRTRMLVKAGVAGAAVVTAISDTGSVFGTMGERGNPSLGAIILGRSIA